MQLITLADIVDGNKDALANGSLLAKFKRAHSEYEGSGCIYSAGAKTKGGADVACAIGAILDAKTLQTVLDKGWNKNTTVLDLERKAVISFNNEVTKQVANLTQKLHDAWATGIKFETYSSSPCHVLDARLQSLISSQKHCTVTEEKYIEWLDLIKEVYLSA